MTTKHTPGPWVANYSPHQIEIFAPNMSRTIAQVLLPPADYSKEEANACPITDTPELLSQLEEILHYLDSGTPVRPGCFMHEKIRAAIIKTEGEANARLIASAPELLNALKAAYSFIGDQYADAERQALSGEYVSETAQPICNAIHAAIAKAEG